MTAAVAKQEVPHAGIRLIVMGEDGSVLSVDNGDGDGPNLPGGPMLNGETVLEAAGRTLSDMLGLQDGFLRVVHQGLGDKYYHCTGLVANPEGEPDLGVSGAKMSYVSPGEVLRGRWGLFARDVLNSAGLMNRPKLDLDRLYRISKNAIQNGSHRATEGVDLVIDEVILLQEIGKPEAVDQILDKVDVGLLHPDIADAMLVVAEGVDGLANLAEFRRQVDLRMEEVDGPRRKYVLRDTAGRVLSEDVRADAREYYRKKAREFGKQLREGTLADGRPGRHRGGAPIRTGLPPEWERLVDEDAN